MTPAELLAHLDQVPAAQPPGLALLLELPDAGAISDLDGPGLAEVLDRQSEILQALDALRNYTDAVEKLVKRCSALSPVPGSRPPLGY